MNKRWIVGIGILAVLVLPFVLPRSEGKAKEVTIEKAAQHDVKASILASGNLVFREQAQLSPELIGKVRAILVNEGDIVEQGQVVLQLDEQVYQAEVAQQEAIVRQQRINIRRQQLNVDNQQRQWQRIDELHKRKLVDDTQHDTARNAYEMARVDLDSSREALQQAEAALRQSNERLAKTQIRAPISGTVMAVAIKVGETAVSSATGIAGSSLMTIADPDSLMTEVNVDEADIANIREGQSVSVFAAAFPNTALSGVVESIPLSPRSTPGGTSLARDYAVKVRLVDTQGLDVRPGMTCRAEIYTATSDKALAVPVQAVFNNNEAGSSEKDKIEHYLFIEKDNKAVRRVVSLGLSDDSHQEIRSGLQEGENVITGPYKVVRHLKDGESVKPGASAAEAPQADAP